MSKQIKNTAREVFRLQSKKYLTPHFIRITLSGDVSVFKNTTIGDNNKIFIPPQGVAKVYLPELDEATHSWIHPPQEVAPSVRTYTHRGIDLEKGELIIDFVHHGENGPASAWAINAELRAELGVAMRTEPKELYPATAEWFLFAGDATALPVISAVLEKLPASAKGVCLIEVPTKEDEQELLTNAAIDFKWIHNTEPDKSSTLFEQVKSIEIPNDVSKFGLVASEFSSVKAIRMYLRKELGWQANELNAYSYWKSGVAEDQSVKDRQAEKKSMEEA